MRGVPVHAGGREMDITIPSGRPAWRFMRYIRPPNERTKVEPIYPLRPATRTIKLGIDVQTVPEPPDGLLIWLPHPRGTHRGAPHGA